MYEFMKKVDVLNFIQMNLTACTYASDELKNEIVNLLANCAEKHKTTKINIDISYEVGVNPFRYYFTSISTFLVE